MKLPQKITIFSNLKAVTDSLPVRKQLQKVR